MSIFFIQEVYAVSTSLRRKSECENENVVKTISTKKWLEKQEMGRVDILSYLEEKMTPYRLPSLPTSCLYRAG